MTTRPFIWLKLLRLPQLRIILNLFRQRPKILDLSFQRICLPDLPDKETKIHFKGCFSQEPVGNKATLLLI